MTLLACFQLVSELLQMCAMSAYVNLWTWHLWQAKQVLFACVAVLQEQAKVPRQVVQGGESISAFACLWNMGLWPEKQSSFCEVNQSHAALLLLWMTFQFWSCDWDGLGHCPECAVYFEPLVAEMGQPTQGITTMPIRLYGSAWIWHDSTASSQPRMTKWTMHRLKKLNIFLWQILTMWLCHLSVILCQCFSCLAMCSVDFEIVVPVPHGIRESAKSVPGGPCISSALPDCGVSACAHGPAPGCPKWDTCCDIKSLCVDLIMIDVLIDYDLCTVSISHECFFTKMRSKEGKHEIKWLKVEGNTWLQVANRFLWKYNQILKKE